jgi:hypothetical protein
VNEEQLRLRLEALAAGPATADWTDARARAEGLQRRRTRLTIAFAVLAAVVVAAPTFAVVTGRIDFWSAQPAPESWKKVFAEMDRISAGGPGSRHSIPFKEARAAISKEIDGKRVALYVAPKDGGFCLYLLEDLVPGGGGGAGACVDDGDRLTRFGELGASRRPRRIFGSTAAEGARQFDVILEDKTSVRTDVLWVSEPIDAGLYLIEVPAGPPGQSFVVRDAEGRELARRGMPSARDP